MRVARSPKIVGFAAERRRFWPVPVRFFLGATRYFAAGQRFGCCPVRLCPILVPVAVFACSADFVPARTENRWHLSPRGPAPARPPPNLCRPMLFAQSQWVRRLARGRQKKQPAHFPWRPEWIRWALLACFQRFLQVFGVVALRSWEVLRINVRDIAVQGGGQIRVNRHFGRAVLLQCSGNAFVMG